MDPGRLGMTGWSAGGVTTLQVVTNDSRFRAAVAMAPPSLPTAREAAPEVAVPTMVLGGFRDEVATFMQQVTLFAGLSPAVPERWFVAFPRAGHFSFATVCPPALGSCAGGLPQAEAHALIERWATPFLLRHVALDERYAPLLDPALAAGNPEVQITLFRAS